jgi:flavin-dependent dehydrogenase
MVEVIGGSLAGASAALELLRRGREVTVYEKTKFPRHKVCGEFLDGKAVEVLGELGIEGARITETALVWRGVEKRFALPRAAVGISRYRLDQALKARVCALGGEWREEAGKAHAGAIVAHGRKPVSTRGERLFGYKAHFAGPVNEAVELYFEGVGYTGVNPVEGGRTNVCGVAKEEQLRAVGFDVDRFLAGQSHVAKRLGGLERRMDWLFTGPLFYGPVEETVGYPCGDALSFVDPFTGSGMLGAVVTGKLAGRAVAEGWRREQYMRECAKMLAPAFAWSSVMRKALNWPGVPYLAKLMPAQVLYGWSRPA